MPDILQHYAPVWLIAIVIFIQTVQVLFSCWRTLQKLSRWRMIINLYLLHLHHKWQRSKTPIELSAQEYNLLPERLKDPKTFYMPEPPSDTHSPKWPNQEPLP